MYAEHYAAVEARLTSDPRLAGKVFDVVRRNDNGDFIRANYLVLTIGLAETGGDRQAMAQVHEDNAVFDLKVRAVGISADAVMLLLNAVSSRWLGWVPDIAGRRCSSIRYPQQSVEILADTTVQPPLYYADVEYTLRSHFTARTGS